MAAMTIYGDTEVVLKVFLISVDPDVPFVYFANLVEERGGVGRRRTSGQWFPNLVLRTSMDHDDDITSW